MHHAVGGDWRLSVYASTVDGSEHLVLARGDIPGQDPVLVRMHAVDLVSAMLGGPDWSQLQDSMRMISAEGRGLVVMIRDTRATALSERVRRISGSKRPVQALRDYGIGAQILLDLGVRQMVLLSNTQRHVIGIEGYGIDIVDQRPIDPPGLGRVSTGL